MGFPGGSEIVRLADAIASACRGAKLAERDLVHGNFGLVNWVDDGDRIWLVDVLDLGSGPVAYDLAEAVLTASADGRGRAEEGIAALWSWAGDRLARSDLAICAGSVALTVADAYLRPDHVTGTVASAPGIVDGLTRALALVQ